MDKNKKLIGSITVVILLVIMMAVGYKLSQPKVITDKDMEVMIDTSEDSSFQKESLNVENQQENKQENKRENTEESQSKVDDSKKQGSSKIVVQVQGEVKNPGIYDLDEGSRIRDLIEAAGGLTENADKTINQALKLKDEDSVVVYKVGDHIENAVAVNNIISSNNSAGSNNKKGDDKGTSTEKTDVKVDINTATKEQLMSLKGIGETYSEKIIEYREKNGPFKTIEELKNVSGIGEKTFEKIKDSIEVK
ncbi:helix-hairpin-helix domain-containing protein [Clostridium cellulovorans]|uniref:Competence protein ComEA helix-hairpin-helix repeat protein n=1 Tax=Clostridium cellulovorans (strain ATCC 35296 / DSM 3052 / OCM 3 / 743B) TaxID=573061 RepID=D9SW08_CLOC7|nr:helix-hairpin-helix domain-containing protein [Clostridium cellulovorans]ADL51152.1 competence protein ComEA helix-hairpin-helix repeat protein [Clostridium cellulovorans 743B]